MKNINETLPSHRTDILTPLSSCRVDCRYNSTFLHRKRKIESYKIHKKRPRDVRSRGRKEILLIRYIYLENDQSGSRRLAVSGQDSVSRQPRGTIDVR